jgi:glycosyltransferase involved in cell wall biosynthesis
MNILVFSTVFYPAIGGLVNLTLILVKEFIKQGHSVKVITDQKQVSPLKEVEVYETPGTLKKIKLFLWCNTFYMPNISLKGAWLLLFNPKKRWIISHNDYYLYNYERPAIRLKRFLIKFASRNIAVSASVANYLNTQSTVIYNCYDDAVFQVYNEAPRSYNFVFLGRFVTQKGCDVLIKACKQLTKPFTLNIIGSGPEESNLKQLVHDAGLTGSIRFIGSMKGIELAKMLNRHQVMIVPASGNEGFGIVVLEGLACGCKVIASNAAGLVEAVNEYGEIFAMNNVDELASLLQKELDEAHEPHAISDSLKQYLENHSRDMVSKKYLSLFNAEV